ncbi:patatin family protein [Ilyobacter sp.]|uniref:patatin-like phospholipase family protein n=1 Tax=Ilyobacter sp. TaxID=3100343 RepID=UPI003561F114
MKDIGLVLEGGGLRAIYTAGVLDFFLEKKLEFPYAVGVSAGAIYPASYVSKQKERNLQTQMRYLNDKRYMGLKYLLTTGNYINIDFTYRKMAHELVPFDFETFMKSTTEFKAGAFNCQSGETDFFSKDDFSSKDKFLEILIASGGLPFISKEVFIDGTPYLDGGIACPIPIGKSLEDGNQKNVVILTQDTGYKKSPLKFKKVTKVFYRKYPKVAAALINRHRVYNESLDLLDKLEKSGDVYIIRPCIKLDVARLETDLKKIKELYTLGIEDAKRHYKDLMKWINN